MSEAIDERPLTALISKALRVALNTDGADIPATCQVSDELAAEIIAAMVEYDEDVLLWSWRTFFKQFLPFAALLLAEKETVEHARKYGLIKDETFDAIALLGNLRGAEDEHKAWLAAKIISRNATGKALENVVAAIQPVPKGTAPS